MSKLFPTTLVGSLPQPDWLIDRKRLALFAAGADYVQIGEPYLQARPERARHYGLRALNRALEGIAQPTVVHICFGYAATIHQRPTGYSFLSEMAACTCSQISLETAQSHLDCSVLESLPNKSFMIGAIDLSDPNIETAEAVAERVRRALKHVAPDRIMVAPDCGMKYLPRDLAFAKMRSMVEGAAILPAEYGDVDQKSMGY
jgi:5-methyltetrahydropteroyltriglutamate--homocysteine methyltransferase